MKNQTHFEVIIIGGSYSGLSAAMTLGRALRSVLVVDGGKPCNRQTPYSHNFLTQDGETPQAIAEKAKEQVLKYDTVKFHQGFVTGCEKKEDRFEIVLQSGESFTSSKILLASGIKDELPDIEGFAACWGISIIHCPYCHGYEVRQKKTGILANGEIGFEKAKMITNWTSDLTLYTNGKSTLTKEQSDKLGEKNITVVEAEVDMISHDNGQLQQIVFKDGTTESLDALYAVIGFSQSSNIPEILGCKLTEQGHLEVDSWQKTTVEGVFACGDNITPMRSVSNAVYTGSFAGAVINKELTEESY
ncbi:NAD(P)/FAD-dependent oxidoreductase [Limibacter armeniacum]|uniref:NAD(P)/FAD-dependent oxidoreductase n=1 Tax=Limibacter armeniacum TaxID=466084 RepID=UPI002FE52206